MCNGCQLMALLGWVAPDEDLKGRTENTTQRMGFMLRDKKTLIIDYMNVTNLLQLLMEYCKCIKIGCVFTWHVSSLFFEHL